MDIETLFDEIENYTKTLYNEHEGEHLWSNYQEVTAILIRLTQIHNDIAHLEIQGKAGQELKKFRTMIVDPTIDRVERIAAFESRKITAREIEAEFRKIGRQMEIGTFNGYVDIWPEEDRNIRVHILDPLITVEIHDFTYDVHSKGNAKCDTNDNFSFDYGYALAATRAYRRLYARIERKLRKGPDHNPVLGF